VKLIKELFFCSCAIRQLFINLLDSLFAVLKLNLALALPLKQVVEDGEALSLVAD